MSSHLFPHVAIVVIQLINLGVGLWNVRLLRRYLASGR